MAYSFFLAQLFTNWICLEIINKHTCKLPVKVGEVIISDVFGADIVATKNME